MADIARYSTESTPNPVVEYRKSVNTPDYNGQSNVLVNPNLEAVSGQPMRYWKHVAGQIQLMTLSERNAVDAALAVTESTAKRTSAKAQFSGPGPSPLVLRAVADILRDEINSLRAWLVSFKAEVALSSSLADLRTRVATLPNMPDRTLAQLKTAIENRIDGGTVD